jgi:hypothetical protein
MSRALFIGDSQGRVVILIGTTTTMQKSTEKIITNP